MIYGRKAEFCGEHVTKGERWMLNNSDVINLAQTNIIQDINFFWKDLKIKCVCLSGMNCLCGSCILGTVAFCDA